MNFLFTEDELTEAVQRETTSVHHLINQVHATLCVQRGDLDGLKAVASRIRNTGLNWDLVDWAYLTELLLDGVATND